jgi:hypothetical protein
MRLLFTVDTITLLDPDSTIPPDEPNPLDSDEIKNAYIKKKAEFDKNLPYLSSQMKFKSEEVKIQFYDSSKIIPQDPTKHYKLVIDFPFQFIRSSNRKFVEVLSAICIRYVGQGENREAQVAQNVVMCSDLVQDETFADKIWTVCNQTYTETKKFEIYEVPNFFHIWLKDAFGQRMPLDPDETRIIFEMVLHF